MTVGLIRLANWPLITEKRADKKAEVKAVITPFMVPDKLECKLF